MSDNIDFDDVPLCKESDRLRCWMVTQNNPTVVPMERPDGVSYLVQQYESGLERHTPHLQAYAETAKAFGFSKMRKLFPGCDLRPRKGPQSVAIEYCKKPTQLDPKKKWPNVRLDGPWEEGERRVQGERGDLIEVAITCQKRKRLFEVVDEHPVPFLKFHRGIEKLHAHYHPPAKRLAPQVLFLWGATRAGKSKRAEMYWPKACPITDTVQGWFDGYDGEPEIVFDEFDALIPLRIMLRLIDRYALRVQTKGGWVAMCATKFIFTSNRSPWSMYGGDAAWCARLNEFAEYIEFFSPEENAAIEEKSIGQKYVAGSITTPATSVHLYYSTGFPRALWRIVDSYVGTQEQQKSQEQRDSPAIVYF